MSGGQRRLSIMSSYSGDDILIFTLFYISILRDNGRKMMMMIRRKNQILGQFNRLIYHFLANLHLNIILRLHLTL